MIEQDDLPPVATACTCARCGAPIEAHDHFCPYCGLTQAAQEAPVAAEAVAARHLRCDSCGAEISVDPNQRSYTCPFCESTYVVEFTRDETPRQPPEFVVGFAVSPEAALTRFRAWLASGGWYRPGDLAQAVLDDRLRGVYLPFWSFSMLARSRWNASIGEYWYRTETYTTRENGRTVTRTRQVRETEWWDLRGQHHRYYSGYLVSGSRGLSQADCLSVQPFHLAALKRFAPFFLAGWLSEEYSVERGQAEAVSRAEFARQAQQHVAAFLPGDTHRELHVQTEFSQVQSDLILLPVYLLSYQYAGKRYRFLINGQTGKVVGQRPISWAKILYLAGGVALLVGMAVLIVLLLSGIIR